MPVVDRAKTASRISGLAVLLIGGLAPMGCLGTPAPEGGGRGGAVRFDHALLLEGTSETSANVSLGDVNDDGHLDVVLVKGRHWPLVDLLLLGRTSRTSLDGNTANVSVSGS